MKFCGRWEKQCEKTFEFFYDMDNYTRDIPELDDKLTGVPKEEGRVRVSSILGQINWVARQGRYDLCYGVSHCQQLLGKGRAGADRGLGQ